METEPKAKSIKLFTTNDFILCFLLFAFGFSHCSTRSEKAPKFTQYYNQGEKLYEQNCSNCHQKDGTGLGRLYPPLNKSDYMSKNFADVICLMRFGKNGSLTVNGVNFNQAMPGIPTLTDLEIAEIATYIYNRWQHQHGMIEVKEVSNILENCPPPD